MRNLLILCLFSVILSSCSMFTVHKVEVEQGNLLSSNEVNRLHLGMSEAQVRAVMGDPILVDIFANHRKEYVYTFQIGSAKRTEKQVTLTFQRGILKSIQRQGV